MLSFLIVGPVAHADVLLGHDGRSKGCGVVEFQSAQDAATAIQKLNDVVLMGRPIFVREDRESETRIGFSGGRGSHQGGSHQGGSHQGGRDTVRDSGRDSGRDGASTRQIYVANVSALDSGARIADIFATNGSARHVKKMPVFYLSIDSLLCRLERVEGLLQKGRTRGACRCLYE